MPATTRPKPHLEIHWRDWGADVFDLARKADRLILLDSGATWCHWCHVMDRVTYEDPEVVKLVNEKFIAVRIDRDRLPHVDARYQQAVGLIRTPMSGGGWPLTVVLTPDGDVLCKATFIPPRPSREYGVNVGLIDLLKAVDQTWRTRRDEIHRAGKTLRTQLRQRRRQAYHQPGTANEKVVAGIVEGVQHSYDPVFGGFGRAPKFFAASALALLQARGAGGEEKSAEIARTSLARIASGGVYDHVGGGFHRYSVDAKWHVPHFEKMAYDNAALLDLYANAYALTGQDKFRRVAHQTREWIDRVLRAPGDKPHGFYASQDADVGLDDDGDYFTWTLDEIRAACGDDADAVIAWYGVTKEGDMHGRPGRNVLHVTRTPEAVAKELGLSARQLAQALDRAAPTLLAARQKRATPAVDKTVFADLNGMLIDAYLTAWERLDDTSARVTALATLDHLLATTRDERGVFAHFREPPSEAGQTPALRGVGLLVDQAWMLRALLHAYAVTADAKYLTAARKVADYVLAKLTTEDGAFVESPQTASTHPSAIEPRQTWEDAPSRSAASVAAGALLDLGYLTGHRPYTQAATKALTSFAGAVSPEWGTFVAGYALAVDRLAAGPRTIVIVGPADAAATRRLAEAARRAFVPGGLALVLDPAKAHQAARVKQLGYTALDKPAAFVCRGHACLAPAFTPEQLAERLKELARSVRAGETTPADEKESTKGE